MNYNPWYTSRKLIDAVKRKISFPTYQSTFTDDDILAFANEEMLIEQVPSIMMYHEEYLVYSKDVPLVAEQRRYSIPERAIGLKLRDVFYKDSNGNLAPMSRVNPDDRAHFESTTATSNSGIRRYFIENNDVVILPKPTTGAPGSLLMTYFLRPSQLVVVERAAVINKFCDKVTINNALIAQGDTISIAGETFTATTGVPYSNEFQIGVNNIVTATNLVSAISINGIVSANNGSPSSNIVTVEHEELSYNFTTSNPGAFIIDPRQCIKFKSIPTNITNNSLIDILQTKPGHKIKQMDVKIESNSISGNEIFFNKNIIPSGLLVGDYIAIAGECIIPQIPTDLHTVLAERTCARILSSIGDTEGLQNTNNKLREMEMRQGTLIDSRVTGAPLKILNTNSLLRNSKRNSFPRR